MKLPDAKTEQKLFKQGYAQVIGIDEVGMGCLAGPVVVCAVAVTAAFCGQNFAKLAGIRDSKLLSESQREKFSDALLATPGFRYQLSLCHPKTIDRLNIYQAARHAMRRAIKGIVHRVEGPNHYSLNPIILVDGPHQIAHLDVPQQAIVKGDQKVFAIACASVIAKVYRDRMMARYAKKYPGYGFEAHKGYGTSAHLASLTKLGPCALHRRSFSPVANLL